MVKPEHEVLGMENRYPIDVQVQSAYNLIEAVTALLSIQFAARNFYDRSSWYKLVTVLFAALKKFPI